MNRNNIIRYIIILILAVSSMATTPANLPDCSKTPAPDNSVANKAISETTIEIGIQEQKLYLLQNGTIIKEYPVSTSRYGTGSTANSNKTPLGRHEIKKTFGKNAPLGTIFKSRANTGKIAVIHTDPVYRETDLVTSRIMWLCGKEKNNSNSYHRYIYIHGTPEEGLIGTPASHGCIRMRNTDVIDLFKKVSKGTQVHICLSTPCRQTP